MRKCNTYPIRRLYILANSAKNQTRNLLIATVLQKLKIDTHVDDK